MLVAASFCFWFFSNSKAPLLYVRKHSRNSWNQLSIGLETKSMWFGKMVACWWIFPKVTGNFPGFLSRKKDFWVVLVERLNRKFQKWCFSTPKKKFSIKMFRVCSCFLLLQKNPHRPSHPSSSHAKKQFFRVHVWFFWYKTEKAETKTLQCHVFGKDIQKTFFRNSVEWCCDIKPRNLFGWFMIMNAMC